MKFLQSLYFKVKWTVIQRPEDVLTAFDLLDRAYICLKIIFPDIF
ncbi:hypothetical protein GCM10008916_08820 [Clostridium nitritogenes]|uniref:Transposase n=1 Tax=Clostridium nitritogenes TaxID=83340 RepID=A0ABN1LJT5_9CLOT